MSLSNIRKPSWAPKAVWRYGRQTYERLFTDYTSSLLKFYLSKGSTVIELGCGKHSSLSSLAGYLKLKVGVDLFKHSIIVNKKSGYYDDYVLADIRHLPFKNKSFDAVVALDVIEHLSKDEGLELIKEMDNLSRNKVVVLTPNGYSKKAHLEDSNLLQHHRSAWLCFDFLKLGFDVFGVNGARSLRTELAHATIRPRPVGELASRITDRFVVEHPNSAFQLLSIKKTKLVSN
jgi:SAM-dependent methyltransferase